MKKSSLLNISYRPASLLEQRSELSSSKLDNLFSGYFDPENVCVEMLVKEYMISRVISPIYRFKNNNKNPATIKCRLMQVQTNPFVFLADADFVPLGTAGVSKIA